MAKIAFLLGALLAVAAASPVKRSAKNEYKMCIPESLLEDCQQMAGEETKSTAKIVCVPARDSLEMGSLGTCLVYFMSNPLLPLTIAQIRVQCLEKVQQRLADFVVVDPEDMYLAFNLPDEDFSIFQEIRTKIEPNAEFRYLGVAVIHKDLELKDGVQSLKGLKSCHTGIGRNVGYKIPLTKLKNMGIIGALNDTELSPRENELKAFSTLFSKSCIVGKWSSDPVINQKLKSKYSNLCQLCENPEVCDYPDKFSGYDGALRCLAHNGGQIAWTKVIFVRKFFGLPVGVSPAVPTDEDPGNFAYLCPDGTRVPVTENEPCSWAARPWQGFMGNADVIKSADELRSKILNLKVLGEKEHAFWLQTVLVLDEKTVVKNNKLIPPRDYLDKANYTDVIEREYGPPIKSVRICVTSDQELSKCRDFSKVAFSRDVRPRFDCVQEIAVSSCLKAIRDNAADVMSVDPTVASIAKDRFNLKPILVEDYTPTKGEHYAVAVVKKNSNFQKFADLKGGKSCHAEYDSMVSFKAPVHAMINLGLIDKSSCPFGKALSEYFSGGSCIPGSKLPEFNLPEEVTQTLCKLCAGNANSNDSNKDDFKCRTGINEAYFGYSGALRCLAEGQGDVAFVKHTTVSENADGKNSNSWALHLKSSDYELLCPKGGRAHIDQFETCNLMNVPPHMILTSNLKSDEDVNEIQHALVTAGELFGKKPEIFKLFGKYDGKQDLLFKDSTTGLVSFDPDVPVQQEYTKVLKETSC